MTTAATEEATADLSSAGGSDLRWTLPLIALLTAYTGFMIRGSYFYADDFLTFGYAHRLGLSWALVSLNIYGHIAPTERFLHYVPLAISPFNYAVGEAIILTLYALLLLSFLWVLRELRVGTLVCLTLLFLCGTSTILLNESLYYDQTVFLFPASIFILCVTALFLRWTRSGRLWALVGAWLVFAVSFVTQERPLVVLAYLVVLRYIVLPYRRAPGGKRRWLSDWRIWLPFAVIAAAYLAYYLSIAPNVASKATSTGAFLRLIGDAFIRLAIGLPIVGAAWIAWVELAVLVVALATVILFGPRRQLVLRAGIFFFVCFLVNLGAVVHGVGGVIGVGGVAHQIQYYVDTLFALGIAVGLVCGDWVWRANSLEGAKRQRHARKGSGVQLRRPGVAVVASACIAVVVVHLAVLPFGISSVNKGNSLQTIGKSWMGNLQASLKRVDASPATIMPLDMPGSFVPSFETPYSYQSATLPLLRGWRGEDTGPVEVTGPTGALVASSAGDSVVLTPATISLANRVHLHPVAGPPGASCFRGTNRRGTIVVPLPHTVSGGVIGFDMSIVSKSRLSMLGISIGEGVPNASPFHTSVGPGVTRIVGPLPANPSNWTLPAKSVRAMGFVDMTPRSSFCITSLQVGAVLERYPTGCSQINVYGVPTRATGCGVAWRGKASLTDGLGTAGSPRWPVSHAAL